MAAKAAMEIMDLQDSLCEYSTDGGANWREMINASSLATQIADKETSVISSLRVQRAKTREPTEIADGTFGISSFLPHTRFAQDMFDSRINGTSLRFRLTTPERLIFGPSPAGSTAAVAQNTGVVTLSGNSNADFGEDDRIAVGSALKIAGKYFTLDSIAVDSSGDLDGADAIKVIDATTYKPPAAAQAAAVYSVVTPSLQARFSGEVKNFGSVDADREGAPETQLIITPTKALINIWKAVVPTG